MPEREAIFDNGLLQLRQVAQRLTYKPGYTFLVRSVDRETALISLRCPSLPNALQPDTVVGLTVNNTVRLSTIISPLDALHAFARVIADFELHEAAEFLKLDGQRIFLPHGWSNDSNEAAGFTWSDFTNLSGRFLRALREFIGDK